MSNARDDRDWLEKNSDRDGQTSESVVSPAEEIANMHFSSENFSTALEYFHKALKSADLTTDHDKLRILLKICDCHRQKGDYSEAQRFLDLASKLSERFASKEIAGKIEYRQAFLLLARGQYEEALKTGFSSYRKLKKSDVLYWLERNISRDPETGLVKSLDDEHGRGLFISREFIDSLIINIKLQEKTEIILLNYFKEKYKGFKPLIINEL